MRMRNYSEPHRTEDSWISPGEGPLSNLVVWTSGERSPGGWPGFLEQLGLGKALFSSGSPPEGCLGMVALESDPSAAIRIVESWIEKNPDVVVVCLLPQPDLDSAASLARCGTFELVLEGDADRIRQAFSRAALESRLRTRIRLLKERLTQQFDSTLDPSLLGMIGAWRQELGGGPVSWDRALAEIHGRSISTISRAEAEGWIRADFQETVRQHREEAGRSGRASQIMYCISCPDGGERWVREWVEPFQPACSASSWLLGVVQDMTLARRWSGYRQQAAKTEIMGRVVSGFVHEFDNLLGVIRGHAELIESSRGSPEEIRSRLSHIVSGASRAASLTRQLNAFGRRSEADARPFDINQALKESLPSIRRVIPPGCGIELELCSGMPLFFGDPLIFEQVLLALVLHSRMLAETGGRMDFQTRFFTSPAATGTEGWIELYIAVSAAQSTKRSIPSELWNLRQNSAVTLSRGDPGLELAEELAGLIRGVLSMIEEPGQSLLFRLRLPPSVRSDSPPSAMVLQESHTVTGAMETILLVEDNEQVLETLAQGLRKQGYKVLTARSGVEAIGVWEKHPLSIKLLLADIILEGGMHGHELGELLRNRNPRIGLLFMTGYSFDILSSEFGITGGGEILQKPMDLNVLLSHVRRKLDAFNAR